KAYYDNLMDTLTFSGSTAQWTSGGTEDVSDFLLADTRKLLHGLEIAEKLVGLLTRCVGEQTNTYNSYKVEGLTCYRVHGTTYTQRHSQPQGLTMQRVAELNDYTLNSTGDTIVEGFVELSMYHDNGQTALIIWNNHYDPYSIPTVNLAAYGIVADDDHI